MTDVKHYIFVKGKWTQNTLYSASSADRKKSIVINDKDKTVTYIIKENNYSNVIHGIVERSVNDKLLIIRYFWKDKELI